MPRLLPPLAAALALLLGAGAAHADATLDKIKQRGKLSVGIDGASPPFGVLDPATGKTGGYQTELAADIARRLGVPLETVPVTASTRVQFLQSGKVDLLIANIQWTQERSEILSFAPTPYDLIGGGALVAKASGIKRWEDLRGKVACVSQGSNFAKPLAESYGAADFLERRGHEGQDLAALLRPLHVGDQDVHLALLQELHAVGRLDLHGLHPHAQALGHAFGQLHVVAHVPLRDGVDGAERRPRKHHPHHDLAALLDAVQRGVGMGCQGREGEQGRQCGAGRFHGLAPLAEAWVACVACTCACAAAYTAKS